MREAIDRQGQADGRRYLLTIAAGADQYYIDGTEMDKVQACLDFIQLMTYDMRGGFQTLTGHHTNLYASTGDLFRISVDASVRLFTNAGVPREKIVIGAAFYSRMWKDVPAVNNGYLQMTRDPAATDRITPVSRKNTSTATASPATGMTKRRRLTCSTAAPSLRTMTRNRWRASAAIFKSRS